GGQVVPLSITNVDPTTNKTFVLTFAPQVLDGTYTLSLGPNTSGQQIKDLTDVNGTYQNTGNAMNQNGNAVNGEYPGDRITTQFAVNTSDDGAFITGLFHDLLGSEPNGRAADNGAFISFLAPVDNARAQALAQVAPIFTTSPEGRANVINALYLKYLRRGA